MADETRDPERIYLQPADQPYDYDTGRVWCDSDDPSGTGEPWVEYIRADLHEAEVRRLWEALRECVSDPEDWQDAYGINETAEVEDGTRPETTMTSEKQDPREAVLGRAIRTAHNCGMGYDDVSRRPPVPIPTDLLARLDAADPLRAILPEVVGALEDAAYDLKAELDGRYPPETRAYPSMEQRYQRDMLPVHRALRMAHRLREFNREEG